MSDWFWFRNVINFRCQFDNQKFIEDGSQKSLKIPTLRAVDAHARIFLSWQTNNIAQLHFGRFDSSLMQNYARVTSERLPELIMDENMDELLTNTLTLSRFTSTEASKKFLLARNSIIKLKCNWFGSNDWSFKQDFLSSLNWPLAYFT